MVPSPFGCGPTPRCSRLHLFRQLFFLANCDEITTKAHANGKHSGGFD